MCAILPNSAQDRRFGENASTTRKSCSMFVSVSCVSCEAVRVISSFFCIIEGCPLSVLLHYLLMTTWARSLKVGIIVAMPKVYADDAGVPSKDVGNVDVALKKPRDVSPESHGKTERRKSQSLQLLCNQQEISSSTVSNLMLFANSNALVCKMDNQ